MYYVTKIFAPGFHSFKAHVRSVASMLEAVVYVQSWRVSSETAPPTVQGCRDLEGLVWYSLTLATINIRP